MECINLKNIIDLFKMSLPFLFNLLIALLAGYFGFKYVLKQIKTKMRLDFKERQLREFYSPLIGYRKRILAMSELRVAIYNASETKFKEVYMTNPNSSEENSKRYDNSKDYDKKQFREELMPLYDKMVTIFTENYYMAESETKNYYNELIMFVEIWHRELSEAIPREVVTELKHTEERLKPFYNDLDNQTNKLSKELSNK
jgi:hypothetical protein